MFQKLLEMPDDWQPILEELAGEMGIKLTTLLREAVREYAERRDYPLPASTIKQGGYRLESAITKNGWINEYRIAKVVYGLDDYLISIIDHSNPEALDDYPVMKAAAIHNNAEFERQFPRDEDMDESNPAYLIHNEETGRNKIRELQREQGT